MDESTDRDKPLLQSRDRVENGMEILTYCAGFCTATNCDKLSESVSLTSVWLITADPHKGWSISLMPQRQLLRNALARFCDHRTRKYMPSMQLRRNIPSVYKRCTLIAPRPPAPR